MRLNLHSGLLEGVRFLPSPHYDARPADADIDLFVIHGISLPAGQFGGSAIDDLFRGCLEPDDHPSFHEIASLRVSAHALIRRDGCITQYVPFQERAWHAGASSFRGRTDCNDFSIGVELEGVDDIPYENVQYQQLAALTKVLMERYPQIRDDHIVGHSDIAPGRKTDPGAAFDGPYYRRLLQQE